MQGSVLPIIFSVCYLGIIPYLRYRGESELAPTSKDRRLIL
jgi:hypothetical protein